MAARRRSNEVEQSKKPAKPRTNRAADAFVDALVSGDRLSLLQAVRKKLAADFIAADPKDAGRLAVELVKIEALESELAAPKVESRIDELKQRRDAHATGRVSSADPSRGAVREVRKQRRR